ncbi:MAG: hypothetical protein JSR28_18925 [Proteobacteria bacterium]|nr:hypothetical protein [Pseudomonadota bacterium]
MVAADHKPPDILTRAAFLNAIARHIGVDLRARTINLPVNADELAHRREEELAHAFAGPEGHTQWHEIARRETGQFAGGAMIESAVRYQRIAQTKGLPGTAADMSAWSASPRDAHDRLAA